MCMCAETADRGGGGGLIRETEGVGLLRRVSAASHHCPQPESSGEDEGGEGQVTGSDRRYFVVQCIYQVFNFKIKVLIGGMYLL